MTPFLKIRRSGAYGTAGAVLLMGSMFLPMSTPRWFMALAWFLIAAFAGVAVFFSTRERRAGLTGTSEGFFILAVLLIIAATVLFLL
jgi:hypothetical protein